MIGFYGLFQIIWWSLSIALVNATPKFVVNEVASNFGVNSYIELVAPDGIDPTTNDKYYGVAVLSVEPRKVYLEALFELDATKFTKEPFYYVIGDPLATWKSEDVVAEIGTSVQTPSADKRMFGRIGTWLDMSMTYKAIIVTGATGAVGTAVVKKLIKSEAAKIVLLVKDRDNLDKKVEDYISE